MEMNKDELSKLRSVLSSADENKEGLMTPEEIEQAMDDFIKES